MSYIAFLDSYFWYLVLLVFVLIGIWSYWYLFLLGGFFKRHKFHGVGSPLGVIFEKKNSLQNQACHFFLIACYPILIPDSESTQKTGYIGIKDMF